MFSRSVATAAFFGALFLASYLSPAYAATINGLAGKCLTVENASSINGTRIVLFGCNGGSNQEWRIAAGRITAPALANKCLDVPGFNSTNGTQIQLFDCVFGGIQANQAWTVDRGEIRGLRGKCLDVRGANSTDGTPIQLFQCNNGFNQKWIVN